MVLRKSNQLIGQRVHYLTRGNFHGVSANWLSKKCDGLFQNTRGYVESASCPFPIEIDAVATGEQEFAKVLKEKSGINYGYNFDCEMGLASLLYAYILAVRPKIVVETGVANGITTNVIMRALEITGGTLHSFDIDGNTSNVYEGAGDWNFHHITNPHKEFLEGVVSSLEKIDLWVHDSNHGFSWQAFEYQLAALNLQFGGVLISDDIDSSTAWGTISNSLFASSFGIFDRRKFFGVATFR